MTPTQLKVFAAIVRNGTSKAAASELGVTEAAVSGHVASLRKELDDILFERGQGGLQFTPGGLRLATRAVELLGLQDRTRDEVRAAASGRRILRLAVSSLFGEYAAPGLIELFSTRASDLEVEMSVHQPSTFASVLAARGADVAIGPHLSGSAEQPSHFRAKDFLRYELVVVTGRSTSLANRRVNPSELADVRWHLGPSALDSAGLASKMLERFAVHEDQQRIFQSHAAAVTDAGKRGVALAPAHYVAEELKSGRLVEVDVTGGRATGVWRIMTLGPDQISPAAAELVRFVSTPRAIQAMLSGTGANISHFRPRVHVTLWS